MFDKSKILGAMSDRVGKPPAPDMGDEMGEDNMEKQGKSTVDIDATDLPSIANWEEGKEYKVGMTLRMTGSEDVDNDGQPNVQCEVVNIEEETPEEDAQEGGDETGEPTSPTPAAPPMQAPIFKK